MKFTTFSFKHLRVLSFQAVTYYNVIVQRVTQELDEIVFHKLYDKVGKLSYGLKEIGPYSMDSMRCYISNP